MRVQIKPGKQGEKGQSFLELALALVFLLMLLMAVIDLGWAFFTIIALRDSAQEAASYAAICPRATSGDNSYTRILARFKLSASSPIDMNKIEDNRVEVTIFKINADGTTTNLCSYTQAHPTQCAGGLPNIGDSVEFKVTYDHEIVTPLVGAFIGSQMYPLTITSVDTLLSSECSSMP